MNANCAPFCETCLLLDYDHRCPSLDQQEQSPLNAISQPGDLNKLFERIVNDEVFEKLYQPQVLSRPTVVSTSDSSSDSSKPPDGPWIVVLDHFLTDEECQSLIQHGTEKGYQVSTSLRNGV
jgi:prolyl 4-hydroxylase